MPQETIDLNDELRKFYIVEDRKRDRRERLVFFGLLLAIGGAATWLCKIALHWRF